VPAAAPGAEPEFRLALGLGAVVEVQRQPDARIPDQCLERDRVPADHLGVHHRGRSTLDRAGQADPDSQDRRMVDAGEHLSQGGRELRDHRGWRRAGGRQWTLDGGELSHGEVEEFGLDAGLADVDADHPAVRRIDPQQHPRPAAVRVHLPGLDDQPFGVQCPGHVAHRRGGQPGHLSEVVAAERTVEVQPGQHRGAIAATQVTHGGAARFHIGPSTSGRGY
jgi:hypothetical protein